MSFRIDPRLPLTGEVRRILADEIGKVLGHLETARDKPEQGVHKCRKRLKAARALLRLVRSGDEPFCQAENECYKQVSALLAGPRQATALIETIDRLASAFPQQTAGGGLDPVRERLVLRQHELHAGPGLDAAINAAVAACQEGMLRIEKLSLPDQPEQAADILAEGARAILRRAKKALDKAGSRGEADDFHDLRKAAKTHSMHLSLLGRLWPTPIKARRKAVDKLGELLGELHDVFVMRAACCRRRAARSARRHEASGQASETLGKEPYQGLPFRGRRIVRRQPQAFSQEARAEGTRRSRDYA